MCVCVCMTNGMYMYIYRHHLIQYGQGGSEVTTSQCRQQRIEQLKFAGREEEREEDIGIDQILEWTNSLDREKSN